MDDQPKAAPQLDGSRFRLAEHERNCFAVTVEHGITKKQILDPAFWAAISAKMRPYDRVEVRCDDGTIFAEVLVIQSERTWARVHVLAWHDLTTKEVAEAQATQSPEVPADPAKDFKIEWKGPHKKFCVIRQSDSAIVRESETTKMAAALWLEEYRKVTA